MTDSRMPDDAGPLRTPTVAILSSGLLLFALLFATTSRSAEVVSFDNPDHGALYQSLLREYRCLKCQNQNLADSNASLAGDLRREIREQILNGKDKSDIDEYLVARYGEFVLYRPRFGLKTAILWIAPFVLLAIGLISVVMAARRRKFKSDSRPLSVIDDSVDIQQARLEKARRALEN